MRIGRWWSGSCRRRRMWGDRACGRGAGLSRQSSVLLRGGLRWRVLPVAIVDGLKGFPEAISAIFPQTAVQTCIVHPIRNAMGFGS